jgi:hypothetical protein
MFLLWQYMFFSLYKTNRWQMCTPNSADVLSIRNSNLVVRSVWRYQMGQSESIFGVAYFVFFHAWENEITYFITYYYQFVTVLTILKIAALLMICLSVFIHSHDEWFVKCRKVTCLDRVNFWNRTIIEITQKIQYVSIHICLKLLRE